MPDPATDVPTVALELARHSDGPAAPPAAPIGLSPELVAAAVSKARIEQDELDRDLAYPNPQAWWS